MSTTAKKYTLAELATLTQATLIGNPDHAISGVESLDNASLDDASFLANPRYREAMEKSHAGVICIDPNTPRLEGKNYLVSDNPSKTFQQIAEVLLNAEYNQSGFSGIHPTAVIHPSAKIGKEVSIGPHCVIDQGAVIGDRSCLHALVSIGPGVQVGADCLLYPHVVVRERCIIGNRVILQPGAVIGSCGFGYITDAQGKHLKLDQLGIVIIQDDVEIGANTTIDRARFKATRIGIGSKVDNLVQLGHNVEIGPHNIIVAQSGIAGSTKTGNHVIFGAQSGIVGHIEIAAGTMLASRSGVSKSIPKAGKFSGSPIMPLSEYNRQQVHLRNIDEFINRIKELEKRIAELENK